MTSVGENPAPCPMAGVAERKLGHATLLYGLRMLSLVNSPAKKLVGLGVLAYLGTDKGLYFYYHQLFTVCLVLHVSSASVGECWQCLCLCSICLCDIWLAQNCSRATFLPCVGPVFFTIAWCFETVRVPLGAIGGCSWMLTMSGLCIGHDGCSLTTAV